MPPNTLPEPPPAAVATQQPARAALQDASQRANQSQAPARPAAATKAPAKLSKRAELYQAVERLRARHETTAADENHDESTRDSASSAKDYFATVASFLAIGLTPTERGVAAAAKPKAGGGASKVSGGGVASKASGAASNPGGGAASKPAASRKRKAPSTTLAEDIAAYKQNLDDTDLGHVGVDMTCDQVRRRINQVLDGGIMKKGEFCDAIGSSNAALNTFLRKSGRMQGSGCGAYFNAWAWFKQRELAGLKMPDVKKRQKAEAEAAAAAANDDDTTSAGPAAPKKPKTSSSSSSLAANSLPDISDIFLVGEDDDTVPVFDSADEIRRKINAHLKTPGLTQAQFCRDLYAQFTDPPCKEIGSTQLNVFRGKKGARAGVKSPVYYAAYVYFEKLRIAKKRPKSIHRQEMEIIYPWVGLDREHDDRATYIVPSGYTHKTDEYGQITSSREW